MTIAQITKKMIDFSRGNLHDIDHFLRVWAYAKTIAELEGLDADTRFVVEVAAIVHDIACPLCREKYGNTNGKLQEKEGPALVEAFLADASMAPEVAARVAFLTGHHHTLTGIEGDDWQILVEADYIANAEENGWPPENVRGFMDRYCKTDAGRALMTSMFRLQAPAGR